MTCRHRSGDPACSSSPAGAQRAAAYSIEAAERAMKAKLAEVEARTPDADRYQVDEVERVGAHLVMRVLYPNCVKCSYEGKKVMVFLDVSEKDAMKWRRINPHFRDPTQAVSATEAPPPAARFPANAEGWQDALDYARRKARPVMRST
jgi:hypothetical protein